MQGNIDPIALARAIAEIAGRTNEPEIARALLELAAKLLKDAGL